LITHNSHFKTQNYFIILAHYMADAIANDIYDDYRVRVSTAVARPMAHKPDAAFDKAKAIYHELRPPHGATVR